MTQDSGRVKPAPRDLKLAIQRYVETRGGKLYAPIDHPDFAHLPSRHGPERFQWLRPHLAFEGGRVLDIGTHWGSFAQWFERHGYEVTAIEFSRRHAKIAEGLRDLNGLSFEILVGHFDEFDPSGYDIVLALSIFHHSLKTEEDFERLDRYLARIDCDLMFFEGHAPVERQMREAYRKMEQDEFAEFVSRRTGLSNVDVIGRDGRRSVYKLER